jgi:hypothetical protein
VQNERTQKYFGFKTGEKTESRLKNPAAKGSPPTLFLNKSGTSIFSCNAYLKHSKEW